jgi:hypothetical protein
MNWFSKLFSHQPTPTLPQLPTLISDITSYESAFEEAVRFSKSRGFDVDFSEWKTGDLLDEAGMFLGPIYLKAGITDPSKAAFQCLKWSHFLAPRFADGLGCRAWPTIGQLWFDDRTVFNPSWADLDRWGSSGIQLDELEGKQGINLHAWITLETGEIIEPSMLNSLATINPEAYGNYLGATVWGRDPNVLNRHRYFPMAVGAQFAESIGRKSCLPLIADNVVDLHEMQAILVAKFG